MPGKTILVPGILADGSLIYSLNVVSLHAIPEFLSASLYIKPSTLRDFSPWRPLGIGPILFSADSPTSWHGWHFLKKIWPASISWASAAAHDAIKMIAPISRRLIVCTPCSIVWMDPPTGLELHC